ncbi:MAG: hypothetical protein U9P90_01100 [Patescibacteria group bacterium]|nr:hypothetical protein [Patescibacteria group bacterium]
MAEIIKKEKLKVRNGNLKRLCRRYKTSIAKISKALKINVDHLRRFDRGERKLSWEKWDKICKHLDKLKK